MYKPPQQRSLLYGLKKPRELVFAGSNKYLKKKGAESMPISMTELHRLREAPAGNMPRTKTVESLPQLQLGIDVHLWQFSAFSFFNAFGPEAMQVVKMYLLTNAERVICCKAWRYKMQTEYIFMKITVLVTSSLQCWAYNTAIIH